ncbi:MAG TPA: aminotransferase class I/II-fold pyridoxal phosphate-dependent enzyme [Phycisphaerae bacterium]|nr:aminotransferase class I/II-fold pyridoxal phosphate-dependent enzyme [Phycisphaerae bacterium]HRW55733.1 aminotransferase class I/II-fold pyridoxal phosphate-dependent enzyme [Phycisphaerae bacterium]
MMTEKVPVSLNLNVRGMGLSATLAIKERCRALAAEGKNVIDFGLGQSPFPVPDSVVEALRVAAPEKDYLPVKGLPALRETIAEFHRKTDKVEATSDNVIVGPGSKELMFILQVAFYGEILLPSPCWVSYIPQSRIIGRNHHLIDSSLETQWKITPESLRAMIADVNDDDRPRLLILNYPSNPTGLSYTERELKELAEVSRKYRLIVLSDEIYGQLHHDGNHVSIGRFYPEGTIVSSGLSKWCGAGGWRLGTFVFPPDLKWLCDAMAAIASETYTSVCAPIQYAAIHAFRTDVVIERYLWHARRILTALADCSVATLRAAGVQVPKPEGGFYLFLDFSTLRDRLERRGIRTSAKLCQLLLDEAGVAMLPGSSFARPANELTARLSYVDFDGARALSASETIPLDESLPADFCEHNCDRVLDGMRRIADWAQREAPSA